MAELKDITVNDRLKIEVWGNGYYWWTQGEDSPFTEASGVLDRAYLHFEQETEETGEFLFRTFIDIRSGWKFLEETTATVQ